MEPKRSKTAIIGVGKWGKNVARELAVASDLVYYASKESAADIGAQRATIEEICADPAIEGVAIATPISTHAAIARQVLKAGKHVLCEKPVAETSAEAHDLAQLARDQKRTLMTGYVFLYHPVYQQLKEIARTSTVKRVECVWKKYGTFTEPIELNLLTHHIAFACDLFGVAEAGSITKREAGESACDRIEMHLTYRLSEFFSHIDRLSEEKSHTMTITLENGATLTWNDTMLEREGAVLFESAESSLTREIRAFLDAIEGKSVPQTMGDFGAQVLEIHELLRNS